MCNTETTNNLHGRKLLVAKRGSRGFPRCPPGRAVRTGCRTIKGKESSREKNRRFAFHVLRLDPRDALQRLLRLVLGPGQDRIGGILPVFQLTDALLHVDGMLPSAAALLAPFLGGGSLGHVSSRVEDKGGLCKRKDRFMEGTREIGK